MHIIINSPGTVVSIRNGIFCIVCGKEEQLVPPDKVKSISIAPGARITSDALLVAIQHEIDVFVLDGYGYPVGRLGSARYRSISTIRRQQALFTMDVRATAWVRDLIVQKIQNSLAVLMAFVSLDSFRDNSDYAVALSRIEEILQKLQTMRVDVPLSEVESTFRGYEGTAARSYFRLLQVLIPERWRPEKRVRRPARDPFNSMLNYAYGLLYTRVESALVRSGLDPHMGVYHRDAYQTPALVFDFVEKYRHWMDYVVVALCRAQAVDEDMFFEEDGAWWLTP